MRVQNFAVAYSGALRMVTISLTAAWVLAPLAFGEFAMLVAAVSALAVVVKGHAVDMPTQLSQGFDQIAQKFPTMWVASAVLGSIVGAIAAHWSHMSASASIIAGAIFSATLARQECYRRLLQYPQHLSEGRKIREGRAWIALVIGVLILVTMPRLSDSNKMALLLATASVAANLTWPASVNRSTFRGLGRRERTTTYGAVRNPWRHALALDGALSAALHQGTILVVGILSSPILAGRVRLYQVMFMPLFVTLTVLQGQWFRRQRLGRLPTTGLIRLGVALYLAVMWASLPLIPHFFNGRLFLEDSPASALPYFGYFALLAVVSAPYLKMRNRDCLAGILRARVVQSVLLLIVVPTLVILTDLTDNTLDVMLPFAALAGWAAWEVLANACNKAQS